MQFRRSTHSIVVSGGSHLINFGLTSESPRLLLNVHQTVNLLARNISKYWLCPKLPVLSGALRPPPPLTLSLFLFSLCNGEECGKGAGPFFQAAAFPENRGRREEVEWDL
ncbi:hypothetical protein V6N11_064461 [Hibiscus sabdariffa]|uniref:Uncharacterized protein n=2 Tax=Hibiscus sabdariffa TaxID=183260 RepID=A0ABR2CXT3_9ROSI